LKSAASTGPRKMFAASQRWDSRLFRLISKEFRIQSSQGERSEPSTSQGSHADGGGGAHRFNPKGSRAHSQCCTKRSRDRFPRILRLDWGAFEGSETPPNIFIAEAVALKTHTERRAELCPALQWLAPWREAIGPIYGASDYRSERRLLEQLHYETKRLGAILTEILGQPWKRKPDALRHSYGSYRYAQVKDFARISDWMGNSVPVVKKRYYRSKRETEASAWFSVLPEQAANVIQLQALTA